MGSFSSQTRDTTLFKWTERLLAVPSVLSLTLSLSFCFAALTWNIYTPRYL